MNTIEFIKNVNDYQLDNAFTVFVPIGITSKEKLLEELSNDLRFPEYFGLNWDALSDCLKNLS